MVLLIWTSIVVNHDRLLTGSLEWSAESLTWTPPEGKEGADPGLILGVCCLGHP